jgi:Domain of unknown function (DUF4340)
VHSFLDRIFIVIIGDRSTLKCLMVEFLHGFMKFQRTTWILISLALALGGFVYLYEIQGKDKRETIEAKQKQIFAFKAEEIKGLTIERNGQILKFEREGNDNKSWQMKQPENSPASDPTITFLLNLLVPGKSDRSFSVIGDRLQEYGLDRPIAKISLLLKNGKTQEIILGKPDFQNEFIYAQVDPPNQTQSEQKIILVSKDFQSAVERDLEEWKQKKPTTEKSDSKEKNQNNT